MPGVVAGPAAHSLWALLEQRCTASPDGLFVIDAQSGEELSFSVFRNRAEDVARWLLSEGVEPASVVAWQMATGIPALLVSFALARINVIQAPVIHLYQQRELTEILNQTRCHRVIASAGSSNETVLRELLGDSHSEARLLSFPPTLPRVTGFPLPPLLDDPDRVAWYYFTSGTTSHPKGACHTDQSLLAGARHLGDRLQVDDSCIGSVGYPIAHIGGVLYCAMALMAGMAVVLLERFDAPWVVEVFNRYRVTHGGGSTAHYQILLAEQRKTPGAPLMPTLRVLSGGGAAKPEALFSQVRDEMGCTVVHAYGMTEAPITACNAVTDSGEQLMGTDGKLLPGLAIKIVDSQGRVVPPQTSGEICLKGANVCKGYLDNGQTAAAFDREGFYHTGDLGLLREDGHLCVTGRLKEIIIRKGENISAREIEELLSHHPAVKDVAVIGLPDEERGELVCAVVEIVAGAQVLSHGDMVGFLQSQHLMRQKIPERLEIVPSLPRNPGLQKVVKEQLVKQFAGI